MANLTIKDIARMAGVSTTAVSFVLNNRSGVSEATREKVQQIIQQTGFTPNVHTRRLNLGKSFTIHVVLRQYDYSLFNQFVMETLSGIFREGKALGYSFIFTLVDDQMDCEQIIESVRSKDCDGVILNQVSDPTLIRRLQAEQIPFVCADTHLPRDTSLPMVEVDHYGAAYQAARYLHQHGHTQIGFIGPEYHAGTLAGFSDYLKEAGLIYDPNWICKVPFSQRSVEAAIGQLLSNDRLPTAIVCVGDAFAIDVMSGIKARGLKIPEDISVMGTDDLLISRYLEPPLTTMTFDKEELGAKAMQLLYKIIQGMDYQAANIIPTTPVERRSVKTL